MGVELLAAMTVLGLGGLLVLTVIGMVLSSRATTKARADWTEARASGALPPSLHPRIDLDLCIGSGSCVEVCPEVEVLAVIDGKARVVNPTSCIGHGECLRACPVDAIQLVLGHEKRGVDIPLVDAQFQTNVSGIYIVGELGGMGLIYNAMTQALQAVRALASNRPDPADGVHQLVIVGAGPAGIAASLAAMEAGLDFVCVDQESLGGTVLHYPRQKLVMTRPVKLPLYGPLQIGEIRKEDLLEIWHDIVQKTGLEVREKTKITGISRRGDGVFELGVEGAEFLLAQRVLLALGRRGSPRKLGCTGEDSAKVAYRLLDPEQYAGMEVLVVGGGDSAVEAACSLADCGVTVKLSYRRAGFTRIKKKNKQRLEAAVAGNLLELLLETQVREISDTEVILRRGDEELTLPNDFVLVFAGGVLPTAFLESAGVEVQTFKGEAFAPANL